MLIGVLLLIGWLLGAVRYGVHTASLYFLLSLCQPVGGWRLSVVGADTRRGRILRPSTRPQNELCTTMYAGKKFAKTLKLSAVVKGHLQRH